MAPRLGGLQKQALSLYRQVLRTAREKSTEGRASIEALARLEFEKNKTIPRKDFNRIEHLLRVGKRRLDVIKDQSVGGVSLQTPQKHQSP